MASEMMEALMTLCQEKHIDELYLLDRLEQSLAKSYADVLHLSYGARVTIDRTTGKVYVYELVPKGEPDEETGEYTEFDEVDVTPEGTSRLRLNMQKMRFALWYVTPHVNRFMRSSRIVLAISSRERCFSQRLTLPLSKFVKALRLSFLILTSEGFRKSVTRGPSASVMGTISASKQ